MNSMVERRGSPRVSFSGITLLYTEQSELACVARDLSETGILVFPQRRAAVAPGQPLLLAFALPQSPSWLNLEGTVVHRTQVRERVALGVRFSRVPEGHQQQLSSFVHEYQPRLVLSAPPPFSAQVLRPDTVSSRPGAGHPRSPTGTVTRVTSKEELARLLQAEAWEQAWEEAACPPAGEETQVISKEELDLLTLHCREPGES